MAQIVSETIEQWGYVRIWVDNVEITTHTNTAGRNYATIPTTVTRVSPFTWKDAGMIFPGFDPRTDDVGVGVWSFLRKDSRVQMIRTLQDADGGATFMENLFVGHVHGWTAGPEGLTVGCAGLAYWADYQVVPPRLDSVPLEDLEDYVKRVFDGVKNRPWKPLLVSGPTGKKWAARGDYSSPLSLVTQALASSYTASGDWQTIVFGGSAGDQPVLVSAQTTPKRRWTLQYDEIADTCELTVNTDQCLTTVFGHGVTPEGYSWRNAVYPQQTYDNAPAYPLAPNVTWGPGSSHPGFGPFVQRLREMGYTMYSTNSYYDPRDAREVRDVQARMGTVADSYVGPSSWGQVFEIGKSASTGVPEILPLAEIVGAREWTRNANGVITGRDPSYNPRLRLVERTIDFGDGVPRTVAAESAMQMLNREKTVPVQGTLTLAVHPAEGHLLEIDALDEILVKGWMHGDLLLHVSQAQPDFVGQSNSLTVSSRSGPTVTVADEIHGTMDATDPARRGITATTAKTGVVWDSESPAGIVPRFAAFQKYGVTVQVPVPQRGAFAYSYLRTENAPTEFIAIVSTKPTTPMALEAIIGGNPWDLDDQWDSGHKADLDAAGVVMAWGSATNPLGYGLESPGGLGTPPPLTGDFSDGSAWSYEAPSSKLWLTVWPRDSTVFSGCRFYPSPLS